MNNTFGYEKAVAFPYFTKVWFRSGGKLAYVKIDGNYAAVDAIVEHLKKSKEVEEPELTCANIRKAVWSLKTKPTLLPEMRAYVPCFNHLQGRNTDFIYIDENTEKLRCALLYGEWDIEPKYGIRNLKKVKLGKKTTVELDDGRKGVATLNPVDVPDPYVAFALAYTKSQFENSTAFYNFVDKIAKKNKRYGVYLKGVKLKAKKEEDRK